MVLAWKFEEIGFQLTCPKDGQHEGTAADPLMFLKCAQTCEDCNKFIGRWISCGHNQIWCKDCWAKKPNDEKEVIISDHTRALQKGIYE